MWVLGISCFRDDATAALLHDGAVVGIAEEERFLRVKHSVHEPLGPFVTSLGETADIADFELRYFPERSIGYLLSEAGIEPEDLDVIAYDFDFSYRIAHWDRFSPVSSHLTAEQNEQMIASLRYWQRRLSEFADRCRANLMYVPHHLAHACGTVFGSGFDDTAFLIADALGELESTSLGRFDGDFRTIAQVPLPHSLGIVYSAVTRFLGWRPFSDEQKTMGLAAYGDPGVLRTEFQRVFRPDAGGFVVDPEAVWTSDVKMDVDRPSPLHEILGVPRRPSEQDACQAPYTHVAAALQAGLEEIFHHMVDRLVAETGSRRLCLAGGVALNCAANGKLAQRTDLDEIYVQPQAGDSGTALGAAYYVHFRLTGGRPEPLPHAYWGPGYSNGEVRALLDRLKLPYRRTDDPAGAAAGLIAGGDIIGWFQGRSECGPRALGNRSILAHPSDPATRDRINTIVKDRETWRPFAASILDERRGRYLALDNASPFMLLTVPLTDVGKRELAAAAHVDSTTRPQTVSATTNPLYHRLISSFEDRTGIGGVLNTSLNVKHEPMANHPMHAITNFYTTAMDALVIGDCVLTKATS
jgi:carbamoyltransferase